MSDSPAIRDYRITTTYFRICSTYGSRSQAFLYRYAQRLITKQAEKAIALLRYSLGGDRPSQTARLKMSDALIQGIVVRAKTCSGRYFKVGSAEANAPGSTPPAYPTQNRSQTNFSLQ